MTDLAALLTPGRTLTAADVEVLQRALDLSDSQMQAARLDARDTALRAALAACAPLGRTNSAKRVARAWVAMARGAQMPFELQVHLASAIAAHGDKRPLSWPHIARIGREGRTPPACA